MSRSARKSIRASLLCNQTRINGCSTMIISAPAREKCAVEEPHGHPRRWQTHLEREVYTLNLDDNH